MKLTVAQDEILRGEEGRKTSYRALQLTRVVAICIISAWLTGSYFHSYRVPDAAGMLSDSLTLQYDSLRVAHGQIPYRDFFNFPTPGTFWLQGLALSILGASLSSLQYLFVAVVAASSVGLYALSFRLTRRPLASIFPALFYVCAIIPHDPYPSHHWYSTALIIVTLLLMAWWLSAPHPVKLVAAGCGCGVTFLFVQTDGILLATSIGAYLLMHCASRASTLADFRVRALRDFLPLGFGVMTTIAAVVLYLWKEGALSPAVYDTLIWPREHYRDVKAINDVPLFSRTRWFLGWGVTRRSINTGSGAFRFACNVWLTVWLVALPVLAWFASLALVIRRIRAVFLGFVRTRTRAACQSHSVEADLLHLCSLVTLALFASILLSGNRDIMHVTLTSTLCYPTLMGFAYPRRAEWDRKRNIALRWAAWVRNALIATLTVVSLVWYWGLTRSAQGASVDVALAQDPLVQYIRSHTTPRDRIAVLPYGGQAYFYGRPAAIGYTMLWPGGIYNTMAQVRLVEHEIMRNRPKVVVFEKANFGMWPDWKDYFGKDPQMMTYARLHYHAGDAAAAHVIEAKALTDLGPYRIYLRR